MPRRIFALLVGIDAYQPPIPALHGCVNDVEAFAAYLTERVDGDPGVELKTKILRNEEATRDAVVAGFRQHLNGAKEGDVALFCYSGHGSQEQSPEEFWKVEPDHLDETLVCHDSRQPDKFDLADKELAKLIAEVADRGPHMAVILDCCHSGSGTRAAAAEIMPVRHAPTDLRRRPIGSFLVTLEEATDAATRGLAAGKAAGALARGRHILIAACRDDETAKEYYGDGKHRGALSYFMGDTLRTAAGPITYRDLFARTSALVAGQVRQQSPQLETDRPADLDAVFLDGAVRPSSASFTVSARGGKWTINGGSAHGIPTPNGSETAVFALFPMNAQAADLSDAAKSIGTARVVAVMPTFSQIEIEGIVDLTPTSTFKAVILSLPTPALGVRLEGDPATVTLARQRLATAGTGGKPSLFVREATEQETSEFRLIARDGQLIIARPGNDSPLVGQIQGWTQEAVGQAIGRLEHMARWTQTLRLSNPSSTIKPEDVALSVVVDGQELNDPEIRLEYALRDGQWVAPTFQIKLTNKGTRRLYCALLDLAETFKVETGLQEAGCVALDPGQATWAVGGQPITAMVPDPLWALGRIEFRDVLKLIVCTQEFDARLLAQAELDYPTKSVPSTRSLARDGTLNRLMRRVQTRDLVLGKPKEIDDWQTSQVAFTTVRPLETVPLVSAGGEVKLTAGVTIQSHPTLKGNVRLTSAPLSSRDLGDVVLPRLLLEDPRVCQNLTFSSTRGSDPGLSVVELTDVSGDSSVTAEAPLRLTIPVSLGEDEYVLPVAYDGEFFLPLGRVASRSADSTEVVIDRLPPPQVDSRSLGGAIKIFFQKVISKATGMEFAYPILAVADVAADGTVTANGDPSEVRRRVAPAKRIAVFVHGIIGDTRSMVPSVQLGKLGDGGPIASVYDLILTFDYENLNTTIEDNGRALKRRLEEAGLGAGHGKSIEIVAHSMGGLVSRWFIEQEGGNAIVDRLVMLGTPNGGSPWPRIADWATLAIAFGLNHLTAIAWPATVLGGLMKLVDNPTIALNQMVPGSKVLKTLAAAADPKIPYVLIAGNTSIIPAAIATDSAKKSAFNRLVARLASPTFLHDVADPFFLGQTNDVAVSTPSMESLDAARKPPIDVRSVACDHLSYFRDQEGLKALAAVLAAK
jgi:pimeloyl-ACP methyl ester carboxylesterase